MGTCIYLKKSEPEVSFKSADHIIPAGIGGIRKLDYGVVSDQFNTEIFSSLEQHFMRNSFISLPRQFQGPGKRGSLSPCKASKSNVHVMFKSDDKSEANLGYIKLGKPYLIPQLILNGDKQGQFAFDINDGEYQEQLKRFIDKLKDFDGQYTPIMDKDLPIGQVIIGIYDNKWFIAARESINESKIREVIFQISSWGFQINATPICASSQVISRQSLGFDINCFYRVCAKIAFNFLAYCKGPDYVLKEIFDPIRSWIVRGGENNGGENNFVNLVDSSRMPPFMNQIPFPEDSHKVFITRSSSRLISLVSFYGNHFAVSVCLCDNFSEGYEIDGLICDWKKRKEYLLREYISLLCLEQNQPI